MHIFSWQLASAPHQERKTQIHSVFSLLARNTQILSHPCRAWFLRKQHLVLVLCPAFNQCVLAPVECFWAELWMSAYWTVSSAEPRFSVFLFLANHISVPPSLPLSGECIIFSESHLGSQLLHYSMVVPHLEHSCFLDFLTNVWPEPSWQLTI